MFNSNRNHENFLIKNRERGIMGERIAKEDYIRNGFRIILTGKGSDFIARKRIQGKLYQEYVEVKTGNGRQSINQKKKMREVRRNGFYYRLYRISEQFFSYSLEFLNNEQNSEAKAISQSPTNDDNDSHILKSYKKEKPYPVGGRA
jgi:hypothetical protein